MNKKTNRNIRSLIIYPKFQLLVVLTQFAFILFAFCSVVFQSYRSYNEFQRFGVELKLQPDHPFFRLITLQLNQLYLNIFIAFLVTVVFSSLITLAVSHRLAGPIVRTRGYFRNIIEKGKRENKLTFRDGDFFSDLPPLINDAISVIEKNRQ